MIQYIFLILKNRVERYESIGKLYKHYKLQTVEIMFHERLILLLIAIIEVVTELFEEADIEYLITKIINDEQAFDKIKLLISPQKIELEKVT